MNTEDVQTRLSALEARFDALDKELAGPREGWAKAQQHERNEVSKGSKTKADKDKDVDKDDDDRPLTLDTPRAHRDPR
jgi:hypothetical protein